MGCVEMVSLVSKISRLVEDDRKKISIVVEIDNDIKELEFLSELDELLKRFGKEVRIESDIITEEELMDIEASWYCDRLKEAGVV